VVTACYPATACIVTGLTAQPPCYWNVTTLAGNGLASFADGVGTNARFNNNEGIALSYPTLYVADGSNNRIRAVDVTTGAVTTYAGSGTAGGTNGNLLSSTFLAQLMCHFPRGASWR
jgi:hypothetical protein